MNWKPVSIFFALCTCLSLAGQKPTDFIFRHLTVNEGLASNTVYCSIQDKKGLWWIGTDYGLQRWDGYRFAEFHPDPNTPNSLYSEAVLKLLEDSKQHLWIVQPEGVLVYNATKNLFTRVPLDSAGKVLPFTESYNSFFEGVDNTIWISGNAIGLQYFDAASGRFKRYDSKLPPYRLRINFAAQQKSNGNFWFGTDSGLVCYDAKAKTYYDQRYNPKQLKALVPGDIHFPYTAFYLDNAETLWLANWPYHPPAFGPTYYNYVITKNLLTNFKNASLNDVRSIARDPYNRIWLSGGMLHYYDSATNKFTLVPKQPGSKLGMDYDDLNTISCDRNGNMWMATDNGLYIFEPKPKPVTTYTADTSFIKESDPNMPVTGFLNYDQNNIWVTTWGRGAFLYDSSFKVKKRIFNINAVEDLTMAWCATKTRQGNVWIGWQVGFLVDYNPRTGKYITSRPEELRQKTIRQMLCDSSGNVWMGTQRGILAVCDPITRKIKRIWDGSWNGELLGNIMAMQLDRHQHIWVATTHAGLLEVDAKRQTTIRHFTKENGSLLFSGATDICIYNDTTIFVAAPDGLEIFNPVTGKTKLFQYPALRTNNIRCIQKGKNNELYFAGPNALFRLNYEAMEVRVYGQQDGLLFNLFDETARLLLKDGRVLFGTTRNFISIQHRPNGNKIKPKAIISGIRIMNQPIPIDSLLRFNKVVELTYDRNYVAIDFAAPSMLLNLSNSYLYKLEGFDKQWKIAAQYPTAEYSNLPPGKYRFMVKYRNMNGMESNEPAIVPIIIHPPFYLRWWFIGIALFLVASIIYLLHRIRVNKLLTMEKVRIHIARDLHDDMGSTLSSINILSLMSTKAIENEPAKSKEYLSRISIYSQRMMESMDDIVWSINPLNDNMERVIARMREVAANNLEPKDIEYRFYIDENVQHLKLEMGKRRDIFLIYKEAINNLAKYSECTSAIIHITLKSDRLIMHIEDNGQGFDESLLNDGNGLINMRKRADDMKGRLTIKSVINQGTELTLNVPV